MTFRDLLRKPLAAAALSFLLPGLGQAAAGDRRRGAIVAIPAFAMVGTLLAIGLFDRGSIFGLALDQEWLTSLLLLDLVALIYHVWAIVDSYLTATAAAPRKRRTSLPTNKWAPALGIAVLLSGTVLVHGAVAKVDMDWQHALYCLTAKIPCWVTDNPDATIAPVSTDLALGPGAQSPDASGSTASSTPQPTYDLSQIATFSTTTDSQNWDADGELNVLLLGIGVANNPADPNNLGPDTIMVAHIGINTGQAELIGIGRNNYCTPLPTQEIAAHYSSPPYNCPAGTWGPLLNALPIEILRNCAWWPIPEFASTCGQANDENRYKRVYKGFEMTIGNLLGIHIDGSEWINPVGMTTLIDALGGVDITVATKLFDNVCGPSGTPQQKLAVQMNVPKSICVDTTHFGYFVPTAAAGIQKMKDAADNSGGGLSVKEVPGHPSDVNFVILPGTYHMNGDWALAYARTRTFDPYPYEYVRAARQQNLLASLRKGLDPCHFASLGNVLPLLGAVQAIPYGFNGDMDITNPDNLKRWASIAKAVLGDNIKQLVLTPELVGMGPKDDFVSWDQATTIPKARALVKQYFQAAPAASAGASGGGSKSC